jgi:Trk K+ transport system NAD-binding subunit
VGGDAREKETLEQIGAEEADVAVVSTGDDMSACILSVSRCRISTWRRST